MSNHTHGSDFELLADAVSDGEWPPRGSSEYEQMLLRTNFLYYKIKCLEDALLELAGNPAGPKQVYKHTPAGGYKFSGAPDWGGKPGTKEFREKCRKP